MNPEDESPTGPMFEPESQEALERLDEIERRLKAARPRPPRVDLAALEQLAQETMVDPSVERPAAAVVDRRPPTRGRRAYRRMAVIAGSWTCGAVVGALVTFVLTGRTAPGTDSTSETARLEKPTPAAHDLSTAPDAERKVDRRDGPPPAKKVVVPDVDAAILAMILDQFESADSAYSPEGSMLWAGMHLARNSVDPGPAGRTTNGAREPGGDDARWRSEAPGPYPEAGPAITRERLLNDLLRETPGLVL
ncbi:MAG: hypothetical protein ACYTG0_00505 [Planctomycetota bacterium]|jgi:hypothetical protein